MRLGMFGLGIARLNVHGSIHPDARTIICNHLSLIETVILLQQFPVSYLAADWLSRRLIIQQAAHVFDFYFVNRAKHQGGVGHLVEIANDPSRMPVVVFPEKRSPMVVRFEVSGAGHLCQIR
jgi:1-acyl-sn-glycerol-3-phosphate acyltransferase